MDVMEAGNSERLASQHTPEAVAARLSEPPRSSLADWVLGAIDGVITTFAIVAGVVGAGLSAGGVVVLGIANLFADGLSMGASRYLGAEAEGDRRRDAIRQERRHIRTVPEGEREEVRQILIMKGFRGADLESAVEVITGDEEVWVNFMLTEELGFSSEADRPHIAAAWTFLGFVCFGILPLAPFVIDVAIAEIRYPEWWSVALAACAFVVVGVLKARAVGLAPRRSALRTVVVGGTAAAVAFAIGYVLRDVA